MQVVFGKNQKSLLDDKFTLLELDTFIEEGMDSPITAYAVLGVESVAQDINHIDNYKRLHNTMMEEYRKRNWNYCNQALEHLRGKWSGDLDSFYEIFGFRIAELSSKDLPDDWDGTVRK